MKTWQVLGGFLVIGLIVILLILTKPDPLVSSAITTAINLFLVLGYTLATFEMMRTSKISTNLIKSPVIAVNVRHWNPNETDQQKRANEAMISLVNVTNNYAQNIKVIIRARVNGRVFNASAPYDGTARIGVQPKNTYMHKIKIQDEFLSRVGITIDQMTEMANPSNNDTQFILDVSVSHPDGFGKIYEIPTLSWYFSFVSKTWEFIGQEPVQP